MSRTGCPPKKRATPRRSFAAAVASYFEFGTRGVEPRVGGWGWEDLHALNAAVDWGAWEAEELPRALRETIPSLRDLVSRLSV